MLPPRLRALTHQLRILVYRFRAVRDSVKHGVTVGDMLDAWHAADTYDDLYDDALQHAIAFAAALTAPMDSPSATLAVSDITAQATRWLHDLDQDAAAVLAGHADHVIDCKIDGHAHVTPAVHGGLLAAAAQRGRVNPGSAA